MDKLNFLEKDNDIYIMSLSELKNMLYTNKKISDKSKNIIKTIITEKITDSLIEKEMSETGSEDEESNDSDDINSNNSNDSDNSNNSTNSKDDYKQDIKKLYNRVDKKGDNQKFTQSSQKLFDRMFSHAQVINDSYSDRNIICNYIEIC